MTLREFEHLLDVYGADRTRWPLAARVSAAARLTTDGEARRLLREAEALDAVLLRTSEPDDADVARLTDRIVAAARTAPRLAATSQTSTPPQVHPSGRLGGNGRDLMRRGAALLAASLMMGIFIGQSQLGARAVPAREELTGIGSSASADRLAMLDLHIDAVDED